MTAREIHPYSFGGEGVKNLGPVIIPANAPDLPDLEPSADELAKIESDGIDDIPVVIDEPVVEEPATEPEPAESDLAPAKGKAGKVPPA